MLAGGLVLAAWYRKNLFVTANPVRWLILFAGLLYLGGAAMTGMQIVHAIRLTGYSSGVLVTLLFLIGPILLGLFAVWLGIRSPRPNHRRKDGIAMALIGVLGLVLWGGLIVGPILALVAGAILFLRPPDESSALM